MIDLDKFRENAASQNLCSEYLSKWNDRLSRKQLVDLALDSKGADYVCDAIAKGWGVSPEFISTKLSAYINGKYISQKDGYDSALYCCYKGNIIANTTIIILIDCDVEIDIPENHICKIYCSSKCDIVVMGHGDCFFICYGNDEDVTIEYSGLGKYKRVQKKEMDSYER